MKPGQGYRWLLLCFCLHEAKSVSVALVQNPKNSVPAASRLIPEDEFYNHNGHRCKKCPAGEYVQQHCGKTPEINGTCIPCERGYTFTAFPNNLEKCFRCAVCRSDQVQLHPCTRANNTKCACKDGTFCSPEHACEMCHKCRARCPEGEEIVHPCTPESDMQCMPPTTSPPPTASPPPADPPSVSYVAWIVIFVVSCLLILLGVGICMWWRCRRSSSGDVGTESGRMPCSIEDCFLRRLKSCHQGRLGTRDNIQNEQAEQEPHRHLLCESCSNAAEQPSQRENRFPTPNGAARDVEEGNPMSPMRRPLVPVSSEDPTDTLRNSFDVFVDEVPIKEWKRFMRALRLQENEIEGAERSDNHVHEQSFQMLRIWQDKKGKEASLDMLLMTLCTLRLKGVAEKISSELVCRGLYKYRD